MGLRQIIFILVAIVVITGIGYVVTQSDNAPTASTADRGSSAVAENDATNSPVDDTDGTSPESTSDATAANEAGVYRDYEPELVAQSGAEHIVLFFHASWCPSCRALEQDINANLSEIPSDVAIYKIDYDTATELKQRYGITVQHSLIEVDANGNAEGDVTHPPTLDALVSSL